MRIETTHDFRKILEEFSELKQIQKRKLIKTAFQAIRIFVNDEMNNIEKLTRNFYKYLYSGGMGLFITFHSLEEKILRRNLNDILKSEKILKNGRLFINGRKPRDIEINENSASKSAKLFGIRFDEYSNEKKRRRGVNFEDLDFNKGLNI